MFKSTKIYALYLAFCALTYYISLLKIALIYLYIPSTFFLSLSLSTTNPYFITAQIQEGNPKKSSKNPKFGSKNPNTKMRTRHHCTEESCFNHGVCIEQWTHSVCNCDRTSFTGPKCAQGKIYQNSVL